MDYLDPNKQRRHGILLAIGYVCMAIAIVTTTIVLVYQAYGYGIDRNGAVIQNGIVFFSSQPNPAQIHLNDKLLASQTNTRQTVLAGIYEARMNRTGYVDWRRKIEVTGGSVTHYDYPLLLPKSVKTSTFASYTGMPTISTQSPDRRWLVVSDVADSRSFLSYDLKNLTKPSAKVTLPTDIAAKPEATEQWRATEWADDNQHVILRHDYDQKLEYILLDRQNPDQSINLTRTLSDTPAAISLNNKKYDQYYLYNATELSLQTASLRSPAPAQLLKDVLAYKSYGDSTVLYFTSADAPAGKTVLRIQVGSQSTLLRAFPESTRYLLDIASYSGTPYVVASSTSDNKVYIYKDPLQQLSSGRVGVIVPQQVLHVAGADYESFSSTAQFIMAEHGNQVAVYDLENKNGYNYDLAVSAPLAAPQTHAMWMDGNRLTYVGANKLQILDYDHENQRAFTPSAANATPFFTPDYKDVLTLVTTPSGVNLVQSSLLIPSDR